MDRGSDEKISYDGARAGSSRPAGASTTALTGISHGNVTDAAEHTITRELEQTSRGASATIWKCAPG